MDLFKEGQKITLYFQKGTNMVEMTCAIDNVSDDRLNLALPPYFMRYVEFLQVGKKLTAKAFSKLGTIDFNTVVISSPLEDYFTIEMDYNSVRLTSGEMLPLIKTIEPLEIQRSDAVLKIKTFELSTEFVKFSTDKVFKINEIISGVLNLPKDYGTIEFKATVTDRDPIYENEYTATFITMTEQDRQTLLYYIYMYTKDTD